MNEANSPSPINSANLAKRVPTGATQHKTAGPYSPVLEIRADRIFVISGQVAVDREGNVLGTTIEEQTRATLANCRKHLERAGCTFADVFKVNAYMTNLDDWERFNVVYAETMPEPRPARTTVGAKLLREFQIEIEMWAAKKGD
jgi:2-iminobutanoate/2-iminopropanoate deaminase